MIFGLGVTGDAWVPPGQFDQFTVVRALGRGGMGQVFLGRDDALDRPVALKFISAAQPSAGARERFLTEARAIARLSHPAVVSVYRIGEVDGRPYLAYEFVEGESLDKLTKPLSWESALRILVGLARGLEAAHSVGIVHRDVKPANVMLSVRGEVKLLDFGLAKVGDGASASTPVAAAFPDPAAARLSAAITASTTGTFLTRPGAIVGTPAFMAPELWCGEVATARSDVFALGLVAYELLAGSLPHDGVDTEATGQAIVTKQIPSLRVTHPDLPGSFAAVVDRCVRSEPTERYETAKGVRQALEDLEKIFLPASYAVTTVQLEPDRLAVSESLGRVHGRISALISTLYARLFARSPSLRALFPLDLAGQERKLAHMLQLVIEGLGDPERLAPVLEDLGRRHIRYRVNASHFDALERALLESIAEFDAEAWTPALERAWRRAFAFIETSMRRGMREESGTVVSGALRAGVARDAVKKKRETAYASPRGRGAAIAYQTMGLGPDDIVVLLGGSSHVDVAAADPAIGVLLAALAQGSRVVLLSPRHAASALDDQLDAVCEVMDAAAMRRAVIVGLGDASMTAALFAAFEPDRARGVTVFETAADGFPSDLQARQADRLLVLATARDDVSAAADAIARFVIGLPTAASDTPPLSAIVAAHARDGGIERAARVLGACATNEGGAAVGSPDPSTIAWAFDRSGRAVRAAAAMQTRAAESAVSLQLAVDLAWCERYPPAGTAVIAALELAKQAAPNETHISGAARRLAR